MTLEILCSCELQGVIQLPLEEDAVLMFLYVFTGQDGMKFHAPDFCLVRDLFVVGEGPTFWSCLSGHPIGLLPRLGSLHVRHLNSFLSDLDGCVEVLVRRVERSPQFSESWALVKELY